MHACPSGSSGLTGPAASQNGIFKSACYRFTHKGLTVTGLESAAVLHQPGSGYLLHIRFTPGDAARFAALTRELAGKPTPRCQLAIIVGGRVISSPTVQQPATQGQAEITGFTSRAQVENLLHGS
jgi:preprotein translocase subunit SecD